MTVLLTSYYYKPHFGGIENSLFYIGKEFQHRGYKVIMLVSDADASKKGRLPSEEWVDGMHVFRFKRFLPGIALGGVLAFFFEHLRILRFSKKLSKFGIDIIISRHYRVIPAVSFVFKSTPHFYVIPGVAKYQQHVKNEKNRSLKFLLFKYYSNFVLLQLKHWFQKKSLNSTSPVVFSDSVIYQLSKAYSDFNISPLKLYPGVDSQRFTPNNNKPKDYFSFLIVGRLIRQKGISKAIKACSLLEPSTVRLIIVGDGPLREELVKLRDQLELNNVVQFLGYNNNPESQYKNTHAFLMTSVHESFGQSIIEAFSAGLPVVAFRSLPGVVDTASSELIKDGTNGFLCQYSVKELALAMKRCMDLTSVEYDQISITNRREAESKFSWKVFVEKIIEESIID